MLGRDPPCWHPAHIQAAQPPYKGEKGEEEDHQSEGTCDSVRQRWGWVGEWVGGWVDERRE